MNVWNNFHNLHNYITVFHIYLHYEFSHTNYKRGILGQVATLNHCHSQILPGTFDSFMCGALQNVGGSTQVPACAWSKASDSPTAEAEKITIWPNSADPA